MAKRTICINSPARISVKNKQLVIANHEKSISIPLEEIWVIVLETRAANITSTALADLATEGIGVITCGANHMPNGLFLPLGAHSRHAKIVDDQLMIGKPLRKRLWQRIVVSKIRNQAHLLELRGEDARQLSEIARKVLSGDTSNQEAVAASLYFRKLLPEGTRRDGPYAPALDYGYAVLRAGIARTAVAGGWLVSRGIHHQNNLNAFNLVDDLIEPFRPIVDQLVLEEDVREPLDVTAKTKLASVFELAVAIGSGTTSVQYAIEAELESLRDAVLQKDAQLLKLPSIVAYAHEIRIE